VNKWRRLHGGLLYWVARDVGVRGGPGGGGINDTDGIDDVVVGEASLFDATVEFPIDGRPTKEVPVESSEDDVEEPGSKGGDDVDEGVDGEEAVPLEATAMVPFDGKV